MSDANPIPGPIVQAICKIQATVDAVKKSNRNSHGGYNFASTDDVYAALTRKMGEVGLICLSMEEECEVKRVEVERKGEKVTAQWARVVYRFVLATSDATWTDANARRTIYIQVTGPQTFQAAQSFCEKAYLRSMFKLPTGDLDLDAMPHADYEEDQVALSGVSGKPRKSSAEGKRDGSVKLFNAIRSDISSSISIDHLTHIREVRADEWATMPRAWADTLDEDYQVKMDELSSRQAAE